MNSRHFGHERKISGAANLLSGSCASSCNVSESPGHSVGSRIPTELDANSSRMKEGVGFSEVNKDKCHEAGKALGCSADVGEVGSVY